MKNWFITGASSGLGRALADAALARGDRVTGTFRDPAAASAFETGGEGRARGVLLDVTDSESAARAIAECGAIDVLVNNAGYSLEGVVEATTIAEVQGQIDTHLIAPLVLIRAALPGMRARRSGRILNLGSLAAHTPNGGTSVYAAVKAGIETLSLGLANEVAPFGIRVTTVVPGAFRTRLGTSRRSVGAQIADYAEADEARRTRLAAFSGSQRGDPARAAQAMLAIADADDPPLIFGLGPDGLDGLRAHATLLNEQADRWAELGGATDF